MGCCHPPHCEKAEPEHNLRRKGDAMEAIDRGWRSTEAVPLGQAIPTKISTSTPSWWGPSRAREDPAAAVDHTGFSRQRQAVQMEGNWWRQSRVPRATSERRRVSFFLYSDKIK